MKRLLIIEDGSVFEGEGIGGEVTHAVSELVFNTSMTGYQEIISDPSYCGQTIIFTNPLLGNTGINRDDFESIDIALDGIIVSSCCKTPSNFRKQITLDELLKEKEIPGIENIDTRMLVLKIRTLGTLKCTLENEDCNVSEVIKKLKETPYRKDQTECVMTKKIYEIPTGGKRVVVMDFGVKLNIIHNLLARKLSLVVVPGNTSYKKIMSFMPDGIFISNGPGDPKDNKEAIGTIKKLIETNIPIFGICLGQQLISLALGADTYKLKFGHRGSNQPVVDLQTGKTELTSQNHGFAVDEDSLKNTSLKVTHINLNDKSIEGLEDTLHPVFMVQFHPEASGGPHDSNHLFDRFVALIEKKEDWRNA